MSSGSDFYQAYADHARILRTWLVAYGIGAPVLMLTNGRIATALAESKQAREIAVCFLVGVAMQVILAAVNKNAMWVLYWGEQTVSRRATRRYRMANWVSEQFWIDFLFDMASMTLFAYATYRAFVIVVAD